MDVPIVLKIKKYSAPVAEIVDSHIQMRLCVQTEQVPTATEVQTTEVHTINVDTHVIESENIIILKRKWCNYISCKNVPVGPMIICLMVLGFLCLVLSEHIKFILK